MTTLTELRAAAWAAPATSDDVTFHPLPGYDTTVEYVKFFQGGSGPFLDVMLQPLGGGTTVIGTFDDLPGFAADNVYDVFFDCNIDDGTGTFPIREIRTAANVAVNGASSYPLPTAGDSVTFVEFLDYGPVDLSASADYWPTHGITSVPAGYNDVTIMFDGVRVAPVTAGPATIFASVWTPDGATQLAPIPRRKGVTWQDPLNGPGSGSLQVPSDDPVAAHLRDRNIVKFFYAGAYRYGFRVQQPKDKVVDRNGDADRWLTVGGPGVFDMLNDAVLYPEYGLTRNAIDQRAFTFASAVGSWYTSAEWNAPVAVAWTADTTSRAGHPTDWPDKAASWIWDTDPDADDTELKVVYFRATLTVPTDTRAVVSASADNYFDLYLNGQQVLSTSYDDPVNWRITSQYLVDLPAGTYLLAARVMNAKRQWPTQQNPAAFLCSVATASNDGKPSSTILLNSNATDWLCRPDSGTPPGWHAAQVLDTFITEAQMRGVTALSALTTDFTTTADSAGVGWTDTVDRSFNIGVKGADLAEQLTEQSIDIAVGPDLVVHAWKHRGTDRSTGPGAVILRPALNLAGYEVDTDLKITTRLLVRTQTGWLEVAAANEMTDGRVEDLLSLANAASDAQATTQATAAFEDVARPARTFTASCVPVPGATPYADFGLGDTVLAPDGLGAAVPLRVMVISVSEDDQGAVSFVPELYEA